MKPISFRQHLYADSIFTAYRAYCETSARKPDWPTWCAERQRILATEHRASPIAQSLTRPHGR